MEELYVYCLLSIIGIDCDDEYKNALDRLFLENPEDEVLLDLEGREYKDAMLHLNSLMNDAVNEQKLDTEAFGKCLMSKLIRVYEGYDIYSFSRKLFELWTLLPENIQDQEPFHIFSYAVECTEDNERRGKQLCEKALHYYSSDGLGMDYETLFNLFDRKHRNIDETAFYFKTDPYETEHFIGYMPQYDLPFWVGGCDIENGWQCKTAKELFEAPIFEGKSLKDRWDEVELVQIGGISIDEWRPEDCMKRHYNWGLFWIGFMMNLTKNFIIFILGLALCIIGIWVKPCLYIGVALLAIDVVISFIEQMGVKKAVETSTNPDFEPWAEIMSKDNWRDELKKLLKK